MGNVSSTAVLEEKAPLFSRLAGTERIDTHDTFW